MEALHELTIKKVHEGLMQKKFSALELAQAFFVRIKAKDKEIHAYLSLAEESAAREAEAVDLMIAGGKEIPALAGVPLAIKDVILIKGLPATAASKILEGYRAAYDATVIKNLKSEHAIFLGKTNMDEFAMGSSTENSAFGPTRNPHDLERVPGGSSGGSAAAVAAHMAVASLGSDTGGSIRQPAALCGVVGLKPTYGAVSRSGLIAMSSSLDQIGPFTKTVEDAEILFNAIKGRDPLDATSQESVNKNLSELRIGLPEEYFVGGADPEVIRGVEGVIERLKSLGIKFKTVSLPHTKYALSTYYIVMPAEVSSNLARFDGIRYARIPNAGKENLQELYLKQKGAGFGPETKRRAILGTFVLSSGYYDAYYEKAQKVRRLISNDFEAAWKDVDVILAPTTPTTAFKLGEKTSDPLSMYLSDVFTIPANLAGLPGISIPTKSARNLKPKELPVGFQLIGKKWHEADLLRIGQLYERTN